MSTKYVIAPPSAREWWEADGSNSLARTVYEPEPKAIDTGLVNAQGVKLYRVDTRDPIGFRRPQESKR